MALECSDCTASALPLTHYKIVHVVGAELDEHARYVAELLQVEGPWKVVTRAAALTPNESEEVLHCHVHGARTSSGPWYLPTVGSNLTLDDSSQKRVRRVSAGALWSGKASARAVVRRLIEEWRADKDIHEPLAEQSRQ